MRDQYNDKNLAVLKKLSTIFELPDFVKQASVVDEKELNGLPRSSFGDTVNRKFPIASKKDAYLSALYFRKHASEYKDKEYAAVVKKNIDDALDLWGVPRKLVVKTAMNKKASISEIIRIRDFDGGEIDSWQLNSPRDFEKAAIQLFEHKNMFSFDQRKDIARQMLKSELKKKASLSDEIDTYLDKAAGFGMCTKLQIIDTIRDRARLYKRYDIRFTEKLAEYAESLEDVDLDHTHLEKTASILDFLDKHTGIDTKYADLPSPEESLFMYTEKIAQEIRDGFVKLQNGSNIEKTAIEEESLNDFFEKFIGDIPKVSFEEKLDILSSLPSPDADDFERYYLSK